MSSIAIIYLSITLLLSLAQSNYADESINQSINQFNQHAQRHVLNVEEISKPIQPSDRLIWVEINHRHGDRTPIHPLPKSIGQSINQWATWPLPPGSLTSTGWAQHQAVGRKIRERYYTSPTQSINRNHSLNLSTDYQARSVYVRSTDVERCVQSVLALMSSIYHTSINPDSYLIDPSDQANKQSTSHSIPHPPLTIVPAELDMLLQPSDKCPSALLSYKHTFALSDQLINQFDPSIKELIEEYSGSFGQSIAYDVLLVADWLLCEAAHNQSISSKLSSHFDRIINLSKFASFNRYTNPSFLDQRGAAGDVVLRDMLRSINLKLSNDPSRQSEKLRIYSSHDTTILSILSSLKVIDHFDERLIDPSVDESVKSTLRYPSHDWLLPNYATVLTTELWMDGSINRPFIQFRIGAPKLINQSALVDSDVSTDWELVDDLLKIRCPADDLLTRSDMSESQLVDRCDLASFTRYVMIMTNATFDELSPPSINQLPSSNTPINQLIDLLSTIQSLPLDRYNSGDGCCVPPVNYDERCPSDVSFNELHHYCRFFRRLCPANACQNGQSINLSNMNCVTMDVQRTGFQTQTIESALMITCGLLIMSFAVIGMQYFRGRSSNKYSSINQSIDQSMDTHSSLGNDMKRKARHSRERDPSEKVRLETSDDDDDDEH